MKNQAKSLARQGSDSKWLRGFYMLMAVLAIGTVAYWVVK